MKIIKCLSEKIEDELHDADEYIDLAIKWKAEQPDTAELFYELSNEELGHMNKLHQNVTELIQIYKQQNGEPPKGMLELYNYLHEKYMAEAMRIKVKQGMYKET